MAEPKVEVTDLDEPAVVHFPPKGDESVATDRETREFPRLSAALRFAVEELGDHRKHLAFVVTESGDKYMCDAIQQLYQHVQIAKAK